MNLSRKLLALSTILTMTALTACNNSNANSSPKSNAQSPATTTKTQAASKALTGEAKVIADNLQTNLAKSGFPVVITDVMPTQMPGIYLAIPEGTQPFFTDKTGSYLIQGDIMKLGTSPAVDVAGLAMAGVAKQALDNVDKSEMIIFPAKGKPKSHIYVFTDPTCHYCRMLHKDREQLNAAGIEIRYLAWPRGNDLKPLAEAVWCSSDRAKALTDAKNDKMPPTNKCTNPVEKHMALGASLGVSGTPAVFTANGEQVGGYLPPNDLIRAVLGK